MPSIWMFPLLIGGWPLLLSAVPLQMVRNGAAPVEAGANTGLFMAAAVVTQLMTPSVLRFAGYRPVIAAGAMLIGVPCLGMVVSDSFVWWYAIAAVRGIGFGLLTVSSTSLPAKIVPPNLLGRTAGLQGVAMAITQTIGVGAGLAINDAVGFPLVCMMSFALPLLGCVVLLWVPTVTESGSGPTGRGRSQRSQISLRPLAVTFIIGIIAAVFGGLSVLVPISSGVGSPAVLLTLVSAATILGRAAAGRIADSARAGILALPAMVTAAVSASVFAALATGNPPAALMYSSGAVFGVCFGIIQTDSVVGLYRVLAHAGHATASKWWNFAIDCGMGCGSLVFGAVASASGLGMAYAAAALALLASAPIAWSIIGAMRPNQPD